MIVDESFVDFADESNPSLIDQDILNHFPNLYVIKSISKSYGVPGLRIGVLASGDEELIAWMKKDVSIWNINSFAEFYMQICGKYRDDYDKSLERFRKERSRFKIMLQKLSDIRVIPSQANYFMVELLNGLDAEELKRRMLIEKNVFIKTLNNKIKGKRQYLRIAIRNETDNNLFIQKLTETINEMLDSKKGKKKMSEYIFLFDLDSTITRKEILPTIAEKVNRQKEMRNLTEATMRGEIPFKSSFLKRVDILSVMNVSETRAMITEIPLNENIAQFIRENHERCYVVTGNLDVWIKDLMKKIEVEGHVYCSRANVKDDRITQVVSVIDKELTAKQFVQPLIVVGDGDNDSGMAQVADISVGFGEIRDIAPSLIQNIDYAFYDDKRCAEFLRTLL